MFGEIVWGCGRGIGKDEERGEGRGRVFWDGGFRLGSRLYLRYNLIIGRGIGDGFVKGGS